MRTGGGKGLRMYKKIFSNTFNIIYNFYSITF